MSPWDSISSSTATQLLVPAAVLLLGWFITKSFRTAYQAGEKPPPPGMAESYQSLDHIFLNARKPQTEWLNMGWWEGEDSIEFPDAARRLAQEVLDLLPKTQSPPRVLDVGHGCGDSLLLIKQVLSPATLHGVTSLPSQASRATARTKEFAKVSCADIIEYLRTSDERYDFIVAIDCAYHFSARQAFFELASAHLAKDGVMVLFDLIGAFPYPAEGAGFAPSAQLPPPTRTPSWSVALKHRLVCWLTAVPAANLLPANRYKEQLKAAGFHTVQISDVSHHVFPGFSRFLQGLKKGPDAVWRGGSFAQITALHAFGSVVENWARGGDGGLVRGVLVRASKT